jgi:hypothetical protein
MNVRERFLNVFNGLKIDRIPFLSYPGHIFTGEFERELRNEGFGYYWIVSPIVIKNRKTERIITFFTRDGNEHMRVELKTKIGSIYEIWMVGGGYGSSLRKEFFIKNENDYEIFEYILKDEDLQLNRDLYKKVENDIGNDGILISWIPKTPFQQILYELIGPENYAFHMIDFKDRFLNLYGILKKRYIKICEILSESEFEFFEIADNITSEMIGVERFENFIVPVYKETCEVFHSKGKKIGSHMDGNLKIFKEIIKNIKLDFIDAFTPFPDTDLSLNEAKKEWQDKVIIINFPSSVHIRSEREIKEMTEKLIEEAYPCDRFMINITENVPYEHIKKSFKIINETLKKFGEVPKEG